MKKILFIATGGTVSCRAGEDGLSPQKRGSTLMDAIPLPCGYDTAELYTIDSTDLSPSHMRELYSAVTRALPNYDGIVVLHGTDTMAYAGAFLALTLGECAPVILTGSMLSADEPDTDVYENIRFAAENACRDDLSGVWLAFCGRVINGADIVKVSSVDKDAFRSYSGFSAGRTYPVPEGVGFPAVIKLTPFTEPEALRVHGCGAVIESYGAGGIPERLLPAVRELARDVPVIVTTPCRGGTDLSRYEVGRRALGAGVTDGHGMSSECAAVMLWLTQGA